MEKSKTGVWKKTEKAKRGGRRRNKSLRTNIPGTERRLSIPTQRLGKNEEKTNQACVRGTLFCLEKVKKQKHLW